MSFDVFAKFGAKVRIFSGVLQKVLRFWLDSEGFGHANHHSMGYFEACKFWYINSLIPTSMAQKYFDTKKGLLRAI